MSINGLHHFLMLYPSLLSSIALCLMYDGSSSIAANTYEAISC